MLFLAGLGLADILDRDAKWVSVNEADVLRREITRQRAVLACAESTGAGVWACEAETMGEYR